MGKFFKKKQVVIGLIVIVGLGLWWWKNSADVAKKTAETQIVSVTRGEIISPLAVSGKIMAEKNATLNFFSVGKVAYLGVQEGDTVKKYQILAYLDTGDLDAAATRAYYTYLAADAGAKKVEDDLKNKGASENFAEKSTRVAAQTTRDMAYDAWLSAQRAVKSAKLVAPFAGVVTDITFTSVGDTASITDGIIVVDPASLYFSAEVDEQDVGKVSLGQAVNLELDAFEGRVFEGTISDIGFAAQLSNSGATVFPVRVKFAGGDLSSLRTGMNGDAEIVLEKRAGVLKLPYEAVIDGEVVVKTDLGENKLKVKTGIESEAEVEILEGLTEGEKIVIQ